MSQRNQRSTPSTHDKPTLCNLRCDAVGTRSQPGRRNGKRRKWKRAGGNEVGLGHRADFVVEDFRRKSPKQKESILSTVRTLQISCSIRISFDVPFHRGTSTNRPRTSALASSSAMVPSSLPACNQSSSQSDSPLIDISQS